MPRRRHAFAGRGRAAAAVVLVAAIALIVLVVPLPGPPPARCVKHGDLGQCFQPWFWNCLAAQLALAGS